MRRKKDFDFLLNALSANPLFAGLSSARLARLLSEAKRRTLRSREVLFERDCPAEKFAVVIRGSLKLVRVSRAGEASIVLIATANDPVGALLMFQDGSRYPVSVIALEPAEVALIPRKTFREQWLKVSDLKDRIQLRIFERISSLQQSRASARMSLRSRVAFTLLQLAPKTGSGRLIRLPLSRQDLADAVDCSPEALIRTLSSLAGERTIGLGRKEIEILDRRRLQAIAEGR